LRMLAQDPSQLKTSSSDPKMAKLKVVFDQLAQVRGNIMCGTSQSCLTELAKHHQKALDEVDQLEPLDPGSTSNPALKAKSFALYRLNLVRREDGLDRKLKQAMAAVPKTRTKPQPIALVFPLPAEDPVLTGLPQTAVATPVGQQ